MKRLEGERLDKRPFMIYFPCHTCGYNLDLPSERYWDFDGSVECIWCHALIVMRIVDGKVTVAGLMREESIE